ncbi:hypothetical protein [Pontibacter chinhatensis]|uniref:YARHG domain-containing protein n=1 Tax=Pontibacter chinhatensis TaxID=1436961 RepID=A0A1I2Y2H8_9BACT|nr:hypothetical protein [Pontibacter chinhatensis]SFH19940.1 hypothetical protein SAMN05421739_10746 [Pontibacter chinhatensis]
MKPWLLYFLLLSLLPGTHAPLRAQNDSTIHAASEEKLADSLRALQNPLFLSEEVLHFTLRMDVKTVLRDVDDDRKSHEAVLVYKGADGAEVEEKLKVKVRGKRRRDPSVCNFPPLQLNFSRKTVQNTIFGKVNKLKLVTHCINDEYVLREYLVYKVYNTLTEASFRVRLCRVQYEDQKGRRDTETGYAFLIEDDDVMAARNGATVVPEQALVRMDRAETVAMARVAFFQFLIGNTDWSVPYRHNIDLLQTDPLSAPIPVPFDFDYAGIVGTPYATPPPELGIGSVRQRLFRGYTFPDEVYAQVRELFNERRRAIYGVYQSFPLLDRRYIRQTTKYLDQFYEVLNNPRDFQNAFVKQGQKNLRSGVVVKGLEK